MMHHSNHLSPPSPHALGNNPDHDTDNDTGCNSNEETSSHSSLWKDDGFAQQVETWLDNNPAFLLNYVRGKRHSVSGSEPLMDLGDDSLEFGSHSHRIPVRSPSELHIPDSSDLQRNDSLSQFLNSSSGSDTPVRKISSHDFDAVGSRPILTTSSDGTLTFISPCRESCVDSEGRLVNAHYSHRSRKSRRRSEIRDLDEREFMAEIILDICNDLDITSLCFKILQNVSLLLDADRCSLFLIEEDRITGKKMLVSKLFDVTADSTLEQSLQECSDKRITVPLGVGIMGTVALTGDCLNIEDAYKDSRFNHEIDQLTGYVTHSILCMPLKDSNDEVLGVAQAVNKVPDRNQPFTARDLKVFESYLAFCGIGLKNAQVYRQSQLETRRNQVLLDLARLIFEEQSNLDKLIYKIMMHTQSLLQCQRCQLLLVEESSAADEPQPHQLTMGTSSNDVMQKKGNLGMFSHVYELSSQDFDEEHWHSSTEAVFPVNPQITEYVARSGETVNIRDAYEDGRFEKALDEGETFRTKAILCMPIKNSQLQLVGVCQLINKMDDSFFTLSDQNLFEAFALFCGLGISNAQMYDRAMRAMARQRVALEVLSYHAIAPREEAIQLKKSLVPSVRYYKLNEFTFTDFSLSDEDTLRASLRMFIDLDLLRRFHISYTVFCRWLLSVKKNYRNVTYHNWRHAFNVAQTMFSILKNTGFYKSLGPLQCLALLIACLCHDLDHRGTNNQFQIKTMSPLAQLYSTSVLEHHHFDQCVMILTTKGSDILANVSAEEYAGIISILENSILATDLARYFSRRAALFSLLGMKDLKPNAMQEVPQHHPQAACAGVTAAVVPPEEGPACPVHAIDWHNDAHVDMVRSMLMTACDVAAITKPWPVQRKIAELVASEFFEQGDIEKSQLNITPQEIMDRDKKDKLPVYQVDFIDNICLPIYQAIARISPHLIPLLEGCIENRNRWSRLIEGAESSLEEETSSTTNKEGTNPVSTLK